MIRIVKPGKQNIDLQYGICHKCGCVIECTNKDKTYPDRPASIAYILCPNVECDASIVNFEDVLQPEFWKLGGKDSESDNGSWEVIVRAKTEEEAKEIVNLHLYSNGRGEHGHELFITNIEEALGPILYSSVESR